ncbi:MAG: CoA-binding protein [Thermoproteota archaeon]|nr:MAG: CoA-binding protein [Candidatus Korarchaeota archaeon]
MPEDDVRKQMEYLVNPRSIAVIGASRDPGKVGHAIVRNLLDIGYKGKVYPVNPKASEILGLKAYPSVLDIPDEVDNAVLAVPARIVLAVLEECGKKGVKTVTIISAGFKETGGEGVRLEKQVVEIVKRYGMRALGPNCFGVIDIWNRVNTTFGRVLPPKGYISFVSQSGAICIAVLYWAVREKIGFSKVINLGNKCDVNETDLLTYLAEDPQTRVVAFYLENILEGQKFIEIAREAIRKKPILVIKSGRTEAGSRAAASHTGSIAGMDAAYDAAFKQTRVLRFSRIDEMFDAARAFATQPLPEEGGAAIVTNAGGTGVLLADACELNRVPLARFSTSTIKELEKILPPHASFRNPLDVIGDTDAERYTTALKIVLKDSSVGAVIANMLPTALLDVEETAEIISKIETRKPILACFMGGEEMRKAIEIAREAGIPNYPEPERAVKALAAMVRYARALKEPPPSPPPRFKADIKLAREVIEKAISEKRVNLTEAEAKTILKAYGIMYPEFRVARSLSEAVSAAVEIGYPVVLKIHSPDILHKTDIGGVKLNIMDEVELRNAYITMTMNARKYAPRARVYGVTVHQQVPSGLEVIVGAIRDPQFGPLIMFGLGGIYVEVIRDVSFRVAPLSPRDVDEMIKEIRGYPLLAGARGRPPVDVGFIKEVILKVSQMMTELPEIVELDLNPIVVYEKGGYTLDARAVVHPIER